MSVLRTVGAVLLGVAIAGAPALSYAQHSFGGGGHGGGGGGGGHSSGGGGGGGGHFSGGGAHFGGAGGAHYGAGHYMSHGGFTGGYAAAGASHYYGGYAGAHGYATTHYNAGFTAGRVSAAVPVAHGAGFATGRGYYGGHGGFGPGRAWVGGYWHGVFWPRCWYYPGFAWYLPVLPLGYATFWWGGVPYYYYNNLYYTYSPADSGYVVSEPPPTQGEVDPSQPGAAGTADAPAPAGAASNLYLYPRNGQSDQQMANDRYECHSWAAGQTGFDPTHAGQQSGNPDDYRRAMISCLDARGYSAR